MEKRNTPNMDAVRKTFDKWAQNGRAELMEIEHGKNVLKFLDSISFEKPFTFSRCRMWEWMGSKKDCKKINFVKKQ